MPRSKGLWPLITSPQGLAGRSSGKQMAAFCAAVLVSIFLTDAFTPAVITLGAFGVIPLLLAGWLLSRPVLGGLVILAVGLRVLAYELGGLDGVTAGIEITTYLLTAVIAHLAAISLNASRSVGVFSALHEVAVASSGLLEPSRLAKLVSDQARRLLRADAAMLVWADVETGVLRPLGDSGPRAWSMPASRAARRSSSTITPTGRRRTAPAWRLGSRAQPRYRCWSATAPWACSSPGPTVRPGSPTTT
jgi:hypothetical protein